MLYFHNADYFIQPIFNSCMVNIRDMLDNGTVINGKIIESPKSFEQACIITSQIVSVVASNQYGEQYIDMMHLGKYLRKSKENIIKKINKEIGKCVEQKIIEKIIEEKLEDELKLGIQILFYQINALKTITGKEPHITIFLHTDEDDEYVNENIKIKKEVLRQIENGIKEENGIYKKLEFLNVIVEEENKGNMFNIGDEGKFDQGMVSINLPQISKIADRDEDIFWKLLDERLELCKEALMCRHYALVGTLSDMSPIHWQHGAIARLNKNEKIDQLLYGKNSTLTLGYVGICEMAELMKENSENTSEIQDFTKKVIQYMKDKILKWGKETNIWFLMCELNIPYSEFLTLVGD